MRKAIASALTRFDFSDTLPDALRNTLQLIPFESAIRLLHNPPADCDEYALMERTHPAWTRVKFDELLAQQLSMKRAQVARRQQGAPSLSMEGSLCRAFNAALPFALTGAQQRVLNEYAAILPHHFLCSVYYMAM